MNSLKRSVIYMSKSFKGGDFQSDKMFPFLNSQLFLRESRLKFTLNRIEAICNIDNIRQVVPWKFPCQQYVFFGRSNVGKSTLINQLLRMDVAETSKQPGKTKELAFLKLNTHYLSYFVDAPGYGFASASSKKQIGQWGKLVQFYLKNTPQTDQQLIMLLIDLMHGVKQYDVMLMDMLVSLKKHFIIIFTKCDRAKDKDVEKGIQDCKKLQQKYSNMNFYIHFTSSLKGTGVDDLRNHLMFKLLARLEMNDQSEPTVKDTKLKLK